MSFLPPDGFREAPPADESSPEERGQEASTGTRGVLTSDGGNTPATVAESVSDTHEDALRGSQTEDSLALTAVPAGPVRRHEVVDVSVLQEVGVRPPIRTYMARLWGRRHFIWAEAKARALSGNQGMLLGNGWLVLQPLLQGAMYGVIFGLLLQMSRGIENFIGYLIIGIFLFQFTARSLSGGAGAITGGMTMIRAFNFPRAALPVSVVVRELVGMLPVIATMFVLILAIPPHAELTWRWLLFPLVLGLQAIFNLGVAFMAARFATHVPDLRNMISFVTRLWFYGSAVFFSLDRFVSDPELLAVLEANPMFLVLDMSRDLLLYGATPELYSWVLLTGWALATFLLGFYFFWQAEARYGRD